MNPRHVLIAILLTGSLAWALDAVDAAIAQDLDFFLNLEVVEAGDPESLADTEIEKDLEENEATQP